MRTKISSMGLLFTSVSAILGSGWLFSAFFTASYAGPASIISWLMGAVLVTIIAFVYAELCTMIPITGSSTRIPHFTHGTLVSFTFSWIIWLSYLTLAPIEVQAIIQYLAVYYPNLIHTNASLTLHGFMLASILLVVVSVINSYSLRWLIKANNFLTIFKLVIPLFIGVVILAATLHDPREGSVVHGTFSPYGMHGIFAAVSSGGIAYAFTGFKVAGEMAGETKNPKVSIPIAVIGSIVICLVVFLVLQFAFLNAISPKDIVHGWDKLNINADFGPFAAIAHKEGLGFLAPVILAGAIVGPLAAGLMYFGSAARSILGMSENKQLPSMFKLLSPRGVPLFAIILNFFVGLFMFTPLPGWQAMAQFLTSLMALTYVIAPIAVYTLRNKMPDADRPFKLFMGKATSIIALYASTLIVYWTGWNTVSKMGVSMIIGLIIFAIYQKCRKQESSFSWDFIQSIWLWIYVVGVTVISYAGNFDGGKGYLSTFASMSLLFLLCVVCNSIAVKFCLKRDTIVSRVESAIAAER